MMCRKNSIDDVSNSKENKPKLAALFPKWICVLIVLISLIEVIFVIAMFLLLYFNKISAEIFAGSVEGSLLSSGIAIIGIAISVWAGLNIVNAIERNEYEKLKEKTDKLSEAIKQKGKDVDNQLNDLINQGTRQFHDLEQKYDERRRKYVEAEKISLLNELSKTINDVATRQLMKIVTEYVVERGFPIIKLEKLERYFSLVYKSHSSGFAKDEKLLGYVNEGLRIINDLGAVTADEKILAYINFRKAELLFYSGYCLVGERKQAAFMEAIKLYFAVSKNLNANLPHYNETINVNEIVCEGCNLNQIEISAYMCNTIGEAYSKIIEEMNKDEPLFAECGSKAIFYCAHAAQWENQELYWRNLGCAYERWDRVFGFGTHSKEIIESYQKAFELTNFDERPARVKSVYHSTLSYYYRYINAYCNLFPDNISGYLESDPKFDNDILSKIIAFYDYSSFAKIHLAKNNVPYVMNGFALSCIVIIKITNDKALGSFTISTCMEKIKENINILSLLRVNDDYSKELNRRYNVLQAYLSGIEQK